MPNETVEEARKFLEENFDKQDLLCPCCDQLVKLYRRKFNASMSRDLITLFHKPNSTVVYYHLDDIVDGNKSSREISRVKFWGLVEEKPNSSDSSKRTSGYWRLTGKGLMFVNKLINIPSHILIYNQKLYGYSDTEISIDESLGEKFDYKELMKERL